MGASASRRLAVAQMHIKSSLAPVKASATSVAAGAFLLTWPELSRRGEPKEAANDSAETRHRGFMLSAEYARCIMSKAQSHPQMETMVQHAAAIRRFIVAGDRAAALGAVTHAFEFDRRVPGSTDTWVSVHLPFP